MQSRKRIAAVTLVAAALGVGAVVAYNPYLLVRAQYERQRVRAGLDETEAVIADHRWVYAYSDDAPSDAPIVVMIHGFTGSKENWYPLAERLRGKYRLLIPDLPGWGDSERKAGADYGYGAQSNRVAAFIAQIARARAGKAEIVLLGHSMGGGIAVLTAARHPQAVDRLGLLDASGLRFKDNQFGIDVLAGKNPFAVSDAASLQHYIDILFHRTDAKPWIPWPASSGLIARRRREAVFEQSVLDHIGRGSEQYTPGNEAIKIRQPTLLLWGRQDEVIDPSALDLYAAKLPQASKVLVDNAGHMTLMEQPDAVAVAVIALIEQGQPR